MQQGRGADAGAAFGSGASGTVFGAQGSASFLSRTTAVFAVVFFATSLGLAIMSGNQEVSTDLMDAPEVEQIIPDFPEISDDDTPMKVPSIAEQLEDIPSIISEETVPDAATQQKKEEVRAVVPE